MKIAQQSTAIDAYHAHTDAGMSMSQRAEIMSFIERNGGSWSIGELAGALGMQKSTVSARLNELINKFGSLVAKRKRKDRLTNITVRPVGLPQKQLELLQ